MKITQGFVACLPDGTFLQVWQQPNMVGTCTEYAAVLLIDHATVFTVKTLSHKEKRDLPELKLYWMPVEVRREVILKGFRT